MMTLRKRIPVRRIEETAALGISASLALRVVGRNRLPSLAKGGTTIPI